MDIYSFALGVFSTLVFEFVAIIAFAIIEFRKKEIAPEWWHTTEAV